MEKWKIMISFVATMSNPEWKGKSTQELEKLLQLKMDEVYRLRKELSRRKGDVPGEAEVDYEKYVTR